MFPTNGNPGEQNLVQNQVSLNRKDTEMTTAHLLQIEAPKDYASRENAIKAVTKKFGPNHEHAGSADVRYVVLQNEKGRWFPLFIGTSALDHMIHFHFNIAA